MRETAAQVVGAGADHAAGEGQHGIGALFAERLGQIEGAGNLVLSGLPDDAGVEDNDVGVSGAVNGGQPQLLQRRPQALGVGGIHLAADGPDVIGLHPTNSGNRIGVGAAESNPI